MKFLPITMIELAPSIETGCIPKNFPFQHVIVCFAHVEVTAWEIGLN